MFKKILVPVDGSDYSNRAVEYGADLAKKYSSELHLLHVHSGGDVAETAGRRILDASSAIAKKMGVTPTALMEYYPKSDLGSLVVLKARDIGADTIIMGSRGLSPVRSILLGSVSDYVVHNTTCPVLIVK
jgi:nucleotide-binding universal stress UspA family protein